MNRFAELLAQLFDPAVLQALPAWQWTLLILVPLCTVTATALALRHWLRGRPRREALRLLGDIERAARVDRLAARALPVALKQMQASLPDVAGAYAGPPGTAQLLAMLTYAPAHTLQAIPEHTLHDLFRSSRDWMQRGGQTA
ncbi:hypothetical protein [Bordetella genomosp. 13]|uniref:hypothetical protein n=1 Tax=Bordetella genomosp. 13 TaxID=463040 RepID=UPI0011A3A105|nr:hypothetical protein [Bordetella genomosp. 13]